MPRKKKEKLLGGGMKADLLKEFIDLSYKGNTSIAPEGYSIDAPLSDSRVKVYAKNGSNDKNIVIVHRGSVGSQDWLDNMSYIVRGKVKGTKSFKLHEERQRKAVEKYGGENMIGLAHSRGGLYLQEMQKDPSTKLKEIITYNKAVGFYDALRENPAEQTDVKVKNDFVSLLSGLQKRKNKMVEIDATANPLDFNKAHQPAEIEKLGDQFIGLEDKIEGGKLTNPFYTPLPIVAVDFVGRKSGLFGSGRAPSPKTLEQLNKMLKTLEGKLEKINKGKVYKTTNKEKVEYELSYTKARIKNHETNGEDLIITKKKKYGNELPAKAKAYKAKAVKPKKEESKKEEPKKEENKLDFLKLGTNYTKMDFSKAVNNYIRTNDLQTKTNEREFRIDKNLSKLFNIEENKLITYFQAGTLFKPTINELFKEEPKKEEPKKEEPKKEEPKKEEPKPEPPKIERQKAFLLGYKELKEEPKPKEVKAKIKEQPKKTTTELMQELENIILNKDVDDITEVFTSIGFSGVTLSNQYSRQRVIDIIKQMNASKSKKTSRFNIEEFITRFNKENCEDLMCKYGINSKSEFRKWLVKNHPDKGGTIDDADFKQIIKCAVKEKYCTKKMEEELKVEKEKPKKEEPKKSKKTELKPYTNAVDFIKDIKEGKIDLDNMTKQDVIYYYKNFIPNHKVDDYNVYTKKELTDRIFFLIHNRHRGKGTPMTGGIFGFSDKEKEDKAERKMLREEYFKTHTKQQNANYTFDKSARDKWKKEFYKKNTAPKAKEIVEVPKADTTMPKAVDTIESTQQGVEEEGEQGIEGGNFTKEGLAQLSKKELHALNKKYSKAFRGQFSKKHKKIGGGIDMFGKLLWSGLSNAPEEIRIQQEAGKVLNGVKVWHLPFWKPADHITEQQAREMVEARAKELGIEALRDKMSREVGFDVRQMNNNKALGLAFSSALDGLSYTPLGLASSAASSVASQVLDPNLKPLEEKDETKPNMEGSGFYYLDEISNPTNPIYITRSNENIPSIIEPETEFLNLSKQLLKVATNN